MYMYNKKTKTKSEVVNDQKAFDVIFGGSDLKKKTKKKRQKIACVQTFTTK